MMKIEKHKYFKQYSNCLLVKGYKNNIIYDLQRQRPIFIPEGVRLFIEKTEFNLFEDVIRLEEYMMFEKEIIQNVNYLLEKEVSFFIDIDELELFPKLSFEYKYPKIISNVILHFDDELINNSNKIIEELNKLNHPHIEVWFEYLGDMFFIKSILQKIEENDFLSYSLKINLYIRKSANLLSL